MAKRQHELYSLQYYISTLFTTKEIVIEKPEQEDRPFDVLIERITGNTEKVNRYWNKKMHAYSIFIHGDSREAIEDDLEDLAFFLSQGAMYNSQEKIPIWELADWGATPEPDPNNDIPDSWAKIEDMSDEIIPAEHPGEYVGVLKLTLRVRRVIWNFGNPLLSSVDMDTEVEE